ncbi:MAG: hypothetical protein K2H89_00535 [Oscillospiraceae bacterium]|nr:hypothetical protein [Oscillospiraceae bacterium]
MSFLKGKVKVLSTVASVVLSAALLGSSLIYASVTNNYKSWKQTGSSWSSMTLGTNGGTVAKYGCAVTSSAMLMVKSGAVTDSDFNPGVLIEFLNQNGGFSADGDLNWSALAYYAPDFRFDSRVNLYGTDEQKIQKVQQLLADGYSVIAQVKYGAHFVAVDYVKDSEIRMLDPGSQSTSLNEAYGVASMTSLRIFRTTGTGNTVSSGVQDAVQSADQDITPETAPETAPEMIPEVPATAPVVVTIPETVPETAPEFVATTAVVNAETAPVTETTAATTTVHEVVMYTAPPISTTTPLHEVVIITKATEETTTCIATQTVKPELAMPSGGSQAEILIDPIEEVPEKIDNPQNAEQSGNAPEVQDVQDTAQNLDNIQIVLLAPAPEVAPDVNPENIAPTEETLPVYVPEEQAEAFLFQIKEQDLYMTVRFYILKDLSLLAEPDADAETLQTVPAGTCLDVVQIDSDFKWGKVRYEGQEGWISLRSASLTPSN